MTENALPGSATPVDFLPRAPCQVSFSAEGVFITSADHARESELDVVLLTDGFITQLADDGYLIATDNGALLSWQSLYNALRTPEYLTLPGLIGLPPQTKAGMSLSSRGALSDQQFSISVSAWRDESGATFRPDIVGGLIMRDGAPELMGEEQWRLLSEVVQFARRSIEERTDLGHRQAWGRIRESALAARVQLDDFLYRSTVLTPEKLEIGLRRSEVVLDDHVIEIAPSFAGAPLDWLEHFDRSPSVRDRYDIPTPEGIVQVLVAPKVRTVLEEIKRLPGRRVAGARAQAFILNPYATLGEDAKDVIVETQFEQARDSADLRYERFSPVFERDASGYPLRVGLLVETAGASGPISSETVWLEEAELNDFIRKVESNVARDYQLVSWRGFDLEIQGDVPDHLDLLKAAIKQRRSPRVLVSYAQVHDLAAYSSRIEGIGIEKPYYSPYIAKKNEGDGWFPENVQPVIVYTPEGEAEAVGIPLSESAVRELREAAQSARDEGREKVDVSWLPKPIQVKEADEIRRAFEGAFDDVKKGTFEEAQTGVSSERSRKKKSLVLRANISSLDYEERRREALQAVPEMPQLPSSLRTDCVLKEHQTSGLAWLQHLFNSQEEHHVRGAVLADDMGLGKTLQLLALMAWVVEQDSNVDPMLVVAPVSLLENWIEEAEKFIRPGAIGILTAYGESLAALRVPRESIDERLRTEDGLVRFLKPGWTGGAKVVLTTYETLRDLEFSFALERWSIMVCDEAQRIKNPAAMVTRAAKKQNVRFKVACTGTPVENTLADLWCLFDFVQPGLLGALNDFGQRYRKPIEAKNEEERARVEELRARIAPQILRRTKAEVARDLPKKIVDVLSRDLAISGAQRNLYAKAIDDFKARKTPGAAPAFRNHLGLLQYLRLICTDPRRHGLGAFVPEPMEQYRVKAPKLDWLLNQLQVIKDLNEKVIIFCEFRSIQRLLQHYIDEAFGYRADIINGDTSASATHLASRQKRIKAFQARPGFGALILSPLAAGIGLNIQGANHVVHYTRCWNPAKEDQATDRAYRIGQQKDVYVYYPVVRAEDFSTFDVKLDQLLTRKRELAGDMLNGSGEIKPGDFEIADVIPNVDRSDLDERVTLDLALQMEWQYFECLASVLWSKRGYTCHLTPVSGDNGIDVVALRGDGTGELIQAKASSVEGASVNWDAVKEVVAGAAFYQRNHPGVRFSRVCLTNQFFNDQARDNATLNGVELLDQPRLAEMLERHPVTMLELERVLYSEWPESQPA